MIELDFADSDSGNNEDSEDVSMSSKWYTPEFRAEAIRQLTERRYPVRGVSQRLGVSGCSLHKLLKGVNKISRLVTKEVIHAENSRLKAELAGRDGWRTRSGAGG